MADNINFAKESLRRAVTAGALGATVLYILFSGEVHFFLMVFLILGIGALEWTTFLNLIESNFRYLYSSAVLFVVIAIYFVVSFYGFFQFIVCFGIFVWVCLSLVVFGFEKRKFQMPKKRLVLAVLGLLVFAVALSSIGFLYGTSPYLVLILLSTVWSIDICAYIGGKLAGRRKFTPRISPNKTWEGVYFGALGGVVVILLLGLQFSTLNSLELLILFFFTFLGAVVGDLVESLLKRVSRVKDSGRLLPGHGGILDRIDSLLAAAPVFAGTFMLIKIYE